MMAATKFSNQHRRSRHAYAQRAGGPLSREQKASLCMLAREAYAHQGGDAMLGEALDDWRRDQVAQACGKYGLTACTSDDFNAIKARFLDLKGETGRAMNAHVAHQTEDVRIARFKLTEALKKAGKHEGYAAAICRRVHKCELDQASAKQVWQLVFTINNRAG